MMPLITFLYLEMSIRDFRVSLKLKQWLSVLKNERGSNSRKSNRERDWSREAGPQVIGRAPTKFDRVLFSGLSTTCWSRSHCSPPSPWFSDSNYALASSLPAPPASI